MGEGCAKNKKSWREVYVRVVAHQARCRLGTCYRSGIFRECHRHCDWSAQCPSVNTSRRCEEGGSSARCGDGGMLTRKR